MIDTNVFVGACLGAGAANQVAGMCLRGEHAPLMGAALLSEYEDVPGRTPLFTRSRLDAQEREELLDIFFAVCQWPRIYCGWRPDLPDEGGNHLIELAVAGGAACIVSRNVRDLVHAELHFPELQIATPAQFLKEQAP